MNKFILAGVVGCFLLIGPIVCYADTWDKSDFKDESVESAFFDKNSIKALGKTISWTEKFILTKDGAKSVTQKLSNFQACKQSINKNGDVAQYQQDFEVKGVKASIIEARYYNKDNEMLCTDKDEGKKEITWSRILKHPRLQKIYYELLTKYKNILN
ncbi:MAG: hypothetical protein P4L44_08295 [Oryzomonas sp.]|uniref:hypothetical protein n=1 Tax=Oryzomonas sp. TaxID=2855186 RepID=UPI00284F3AE0|nr:hypothetical protein [Oryzomonas sp.]MDR3579945.1 hypothetical protein [Oryzomonas sp.]